MYLYYSSYHARMQSFTCWPTASKPEKLSSAGFFHTVELHYNFKPIFNIIILKPNIDFVMVILNQTVGLESITFCLDDLV